MPDMVMDKYKQCQATCFSGVFPDIQYAWASIDNLLYIWDTTRWLPSAPTHHTPLQLMTLCSNSTAAKPWFLIPPLRTYRVPFHVHSCSRQHY